MSLDQLYTIFNLTQVSELLGSWGDNEQSPECLDGAQVCLRPGGISIPATYTSFISLVSAPKLRTFVQEMPDKKVKPCFCSGPMLEGL